MRLPAYAKINLSLRVLRRREDGFHDIRTLMVPVTLADELEVDRTTEPGVAFTCDDPSLPNDETNLCVRAARAFAEAHPFEGGIQIALSKRIPHGAGLGGGSSDAGAVLRAMRELIHPDLADAELESIAASFGSDIPFFVRSAPAWCEGRGEQITPTPFPETQDILLIKPPFPVPTPWAYQRWCDSQEIPGVAYAPVPFSWGELVNDLERPVFEKHLLLARMKGWLAAQPGVKGALLSGSGSTMFAILEAPGNAASLSEAVRAEFGPSHWTHSCRVLANP